MTFTIGSFYLCINVLVLNDHAWLLHGKHKPLEKSIKERKRFVSVAVGEAAGQW